MSALLILSPNGTPARQTFLVLNRHTFHHLQYLHYFPFIRIAFVHVASLYIHSTSVCPIERMIKYKFQKINAIQKLNFFQAHGQKQ